jgi:hypothetical protein
MDDWEQALNAFLDSWRSKPEVIGAMVCGSFVTGSPSKHSDIDVHIVLDDKVDWRERGNKIVEGFLIEYFANPPKQFRRYFQEDYGDNDRSAATQFATGRIIFDEAGVIAHLKKEAAEWLVKPFAPVSETSLELSKCILWDNLDNLQAAFEQDAPDFSYVYHQTLQRIYVSYARFMRQPIISFSKTYGCLSCPKTAKRKYLMEPFPDKEFLEMFFAGVKEEDHPKMLRYVESLTNYVMEKFGGFHIDGWKFRSPADCR